MTDIVKEAAKLNGHNFTSGNSNNNHNNNNNTDDNIDQQQQQQTARFITTSATNFEFRPSSKENGKNSKGIRSKSPGAFIERLSSFARGKYRSSLSERPTQSKNYDERPRR
ncbi:hypothetical protein WUBG_15998, partial [Wuchereria bancrofti]